jgi:hypothetical protein
MKLPRLDEPARYRGLYVFDFGDWSAVGYTVEEIARLLESETHRGGKVYKIVRAQPDGTLELRGVPHTRFRAESGAFFNRGDQAAAQSDFDGLCRAAEALPPPCRAFVQLAQRPAAEGVPRYVTALIYPAEYEDELSRWLLDLEYAGGDTVEGGISHVTNYYAGTHTVLDRRQLWSQGTLAARSTEELLANVRRAVQR